MIADNKKTPDDLLNWRFRIDEKKKKGNMEAIRQAVYQKHIQKYPSFAENVWNQMRFQTWQHWVAQGAVLLFAMFFVLWFYKKNIPYTETIAVCSVFLVLAANICLSSVLHLFSHHLAELEKTLYLDLKQMVCIRLLEAGIADFVLFGLLIELLNNRSNISILQSFFYLLVPFVWSELFYLHMLTHIRTGLSGFRQFSFCALCCILTLIPTIWKDVYLQEYLLVWKMLAIAGCLLLTVEIYKMFRQIDLGESIC